MLGDNSDRSWEQWGKTEPYYGVLTSEKFRRAKIDPAARREFFTSGSAHMAALLERVEALLGPVSRGSALDFGCGVGRLTLPLAREGRFSMVTGTDISKSMLQEAERNAQESQISNIEFLISDDKLLRLTGSYDFVHSYIVLQHIPVARGEMIFRQLLGRLAPGGVAALHMPIQRSVGAIRNLTNFLRVRALPLHVISNLLQRRPWNEPLMQMNQYNMNSLFEILIEFGIPQATTEFMNNGGNIGAYLLVRNRA